MEKNPCLFLAGNGGVEILGGFNQQFSADFQYHHASNVYYALSVTCF